MNKRITPKERGLLKGAIRRVFSRSELRQRILLLYTIDHFDPKRPRVKKWGWCAECGEVVPRYKLQIDHMSPVVPIHLSLEQLGWDTLVDRVWCEENNLQALCENCHGIKTKAEAKQRREAKKKGR